MNKYTSDHLPRERNPLDFIRNFSIFATYDTDKVWFFTRIIRAALPKFTFDRWEKYGPWFPISYKPPTIKGKTSESYTFNLIECSDDNWTQANSDGFFRMVDGIILIVDFTQGVTEAIKKILFRSHQAGIKPLLIINMREEALMEVSINHEMFYFKLEEIFEKLNDRLVFEFGTKNKQYRYDPRENNVLFTCKDGCWGFTLSKVAEYYAAHDKAIKVDKFLSNLWGDHFYDASEDLWSDEKACDENGKLKGQRAFSYFVMSPILGLYKACQEQDFPTIERAIKKLKIPLEALKEFVGKFDPRLANVIIRTWMNLDTVLFNAIVECIPSCTEAQTIRHAEAYKSSNKTNNPISDALKKSSQKGPCIIYGYRILPIKCGVSKGFLLFTRILSGRIHVDEMLNVLVNDPKGLKCFEGQRIKYQYRINETGALVENYGVKAGDFTLFSLECGKDVLLRDVLISEMKLEHHYNSYGFNNKYYSRAFIEPKNPTELPELLTAIRVLYQIDPLTKVEVQETGLHTIYALDVRHLERSLEILNRFTEIKVVDWLPVLKESVSKKSEHPCPSYSFSKANCIISFAEPFDTAFAIELERELCDAAKLQADPEKLFALSKWEKQDVQKLWAFGPPTAKGNALVHRIIESSIDESVKQAIKNGFLWGCEEGPLAAENIKGVKFNLVETVIGQEYAKKAGGRIAKLARNSFFAGFMCAGPGVCEPVADLNIVLTYQEWALADEIKSLRCFWLRDEVIENGNLLLSGRVDLIDFEKLDKKSEVYYRLQQLLKLFPARWKLETDFLNPKSSSFERLVTLRRFRGLKDEFPTTDSLINIAEQ